MPVERWTDEQLDGLATSVADLRIAAVSLLETATIHQQGLETSQQNFQIILSRMEQMQSQVRDMQSEIRGFQTENRRILERFEGGLLRPQYREIFCLNRTTTSNK